MKPQYYLLTVIVISLLVPSACNDNSSGSEGEEMATVSGTIKAPDGETPIAGATVYTLGEGSAMGSNMALDCAEPKEEYAAYTCTNADGTFSFDILVDGSTATLKVEKGVFSFEKTIDITGEDVQVGDIPMPSGAELNTKIAVVTGSYDRMQDILAKLGLGEIGTDPNSGNYGFLVDGTEEFDLYDGNSSLSGEYPEYTALFEDNDGDGQADIYNYDLVFINCGAAENPVFKSSTSLAHAHEHSAKHAKAHRLSPKENAALQGFVEQGGLLYTTDLAYDYVEQSFPAFINYYGSDGIAANQPEELNEAQVGESGIEVDAEILQPNLQSWLPTVSCNNGQSCLNSDNTVYITDFLFGWGLMEGVHGSADVNFWVEGGVDWFGGSGVRPLTASFDVGEGKVIYSSYHTVETEHSPYWRPQERILQFLVFE